MRHRLLREIDIVDVDVVDIFEMRSRADHERRFAAMPGGGAKRLKLRCGGIDVQIRIALLANRIRKPQKNHVDLLRLSRAAEAVEQLAMIKIPKRHMVMTG